jgi:hypothetical protein
MSCEFFTIWSPFAPRPWLGREQANNDLLLRTATSFAQTEGGR